jgi:hypothetical protein
MSTQSPLLANNARNGAPGREKSKVSRPGLLSDHMQVGVLVRRDSRNVDGVVQAASIANRLQLCERWETSNSTTDGGPFVHASRVDDALVRSLRSIGGRLAIGIAQY